MKTIHAVYEDGVFRPFDPVELPEKCEVEFQPKVVKKPSKKGKMKKIFATLSQSFETNISTLSQRHNDHQP